MSKIAVALSLVSVVAVGGMVVLNAGLMDRIGDLESQVAEQSTQLSAAAKVTPVAGSRSAAGARVDPRVDDLTARFAELESRVAAAPAVVARATDGGTPAAAPAISYQGTELEQAVASVLDAREAARRHERMTKMAEGRSRMLLRDLEIDEGRRAQIEALTLEHLVRRDERRDGLQDGDREGRRALETELQEQFRATLASVLTTTEMEAIANRIDSRRRGNESRIGAEDGGRRGRRRPGRGGNQ